MFNFPGLRQNEHIVFFIRKQWTAYISVVVKLFLNLAVVFLFAYFLLNKMPTGSAIHTIFLELLLLYLLGVWWWVFNAWLDEALDTFVVTNERMIDTTQSAFLSMEIASADLDQIQDVRGKIAGFLGGLFRFGNLETQTAGSKILFLMDYVENPERYIDQIIELKNEYIAKKNEGV